MLPTYPAVLRDGLLEWGNEGAPMSLKDQPLEVHVTVLTPQTWSQTNGPAMAAALAAIASTGGPSIGDPVEWQRESRADRSMPGRV